MKKKLDQDPQRRRLVLQHEAIAWLTAPELGVAQGGVQATTGTTFTRRAAGADC